MNMVYSNKGGMNPKTYAKILPSSTINQFVGWQVSAGHLNLWILRLYHAFIDKQYATIGPKQVPQVF